MRRAAPAERPEVKILILGAGAIGGYVGGRLQQSGADVTFLVRPARQRGDQRDGLVIKSTKGDITQKVKTVLKGSEGGPYDLVLLTCKAYDLDSAIEAIAPAVGANTTVVPLLNGMRHLDVLDAKFGKDKVVGGLARVGVAMSADGVDPAHQPVRGDLLRRARRQGAARRRWSSSMRRSRSPASMAG